MGAAHPGDAVARRLEPAAVPPLTWRACNDVAGYQCATTRVPLSYRDPGGEQVVLTLGRLRATDRKRRIGTLFVNPGGPGISGRFPSGVSRALRERFDIVGFYPRGVGASSGVRCADAGVDTEPLFAPRLPTTIGEAHRAAAAVRDGADRCARRGGAMLAHASTANVARDLDRLRQAVGDLGLNYIGYSYGTHIGEVYANLFPDRVRAITLDGVIDPIEWTTGRDPEDARMPVGFRMGSYLGAKRALASFLADCRRADHCAFSKPGIEVEPAFTRRCDVCWTARFGCATTTGSSATRIETRSTSSTSC